MNSINPSNTNNQSYPPPHPYPPPQYLYEEDEIDLLELWNILWKGKWFILLFTAFCTFLSSWYAFNQTTIYKAEVVLAPVTEEGNQGNLGALAGQYGTIAAMAGINFGSNYSNIETNLAILQSREFLYKFIKENELIPILFKERLREDKKTVQTSESYKSPTLWDAYNRFKNLLKISRNSKSGIVTLSISWHDPLLSAKWANDLVERINTYLRLKAITEARKSIEFLEKEIAKTSVIAMQEILYRLIEKQTQAITLAQVREQFAFSIIDPAVTPEIPDKPNRRLTIILGLLTGICASIFLQFFIAFITDIRKSLKKK